MAATGTSRTHMLFKQAEDMKISLNSLVPVFLIFILVPAKVMPNENISVEPAKLEKKVGDSATISCSVSKEIDIRQISFLKNKFEILSVTIQNDTSSKLTFSGTFEKFKWLIKGNTYKCTDKKGGLEESDQVECPSTNTSSTLFLYNETQEMASFCVTPREYHSRLDITGTIRDLKVTLTNLSEKDETIYNCKGKANYVGDLDGTSTILTVRSHGRSLHTGTLALASAMVLSSSLFHLY